MLGSVEQKKPDQLLLKTRCETEGLAGSRPRQSGIEREFALGLM